jgi:hypothetical protein
MGEERRRRFYENSRWARPMNANAKATHTPPHNHLGTLQLPSPAPGDAADTARPLVPASKLVQARKAPAVLTV